MPHPRVYDEEGMVSAFCWGVVSLHKCNTEQKIYKEKYIFLQAETKSETSSRQCLKLCDYITSNQNTTKLHLYLLTDSKGYRHIFVVWSRVFSVILKKFLSLLATVRLEVLCYDQIRMSSVKKSMEEAKSNLFENFYVAMKNRVCSYAALFEIINIYRNHSFIILNKLTYMVLCGTFYTYRSFKLWSIYTINVYRTTPRLCVLFSAVFYILMKYFGYSKPCQQFFLTLRNHCPQKQFLS